MNLIGWLTTRLKLLWHLRSAGRSSAGSSAAADTNRATCSSDGAPPMPLIQPVTVRPTAHQGSVLSFDQHGTMRYACLNLPQQAAAEPNAGRQWPLLIYLHGSLTTPDSLYWFGRQLFQLHHHYPLSSDPAIQGFIVLSPEGRRAKPWRSDGPQTGAGFHWDEWHRNPADNLDALAIDHFVDQVVATGRVDPRRIYVFGWSNGAYMAALYGVWRSERIAAIAQYAGADPWSRSPCPVPLRYDRQTPLVLLRNLCDRLVPCAASSAWIATLTEQGWPFKAYNLDLRGNITAASACDQRCSTIKGLYAHGRWPRTRALEEMLSFLKQHPLP